MRFNRQKVDTYLQRFFLRRKLINLSVGIIQEDGLSYFNYGFESTPHLDGKFALYELGSITKLFVASVLASSIKKGYIKLHDTLDSLLGGHVEMMPQFRDLTIHSLLAHTSGLPRLPNEFLDSIDDINNPYKNFDESVIVEYLRLSEDEVINKKYEYSNLGYGILGYMLSVLFRKDLFSIIKETILDPLEMNYTCNLPQASHDNLLHGHNTSNHIVPHWEMNVFKGAGFLLSNTFDMTKFLDANLNVTNPLYSSLALTHVFENKNRVALGWHKHGLLSKIIGYHRYIWHDGMTGGFSSYITLNESIVKGAILLTNKSVDLKECALGLYGYLGFRTHVLR